MEPASPTARKPRLSRRGLPNDQETHEENVVLHRSRVHRRFVARLPPCEGGVRGGGPGGTRACYAVPGRLGQAGVPAEGQGPPLRSKVLVMPCSPPLTPPSQGGERDRSLAADSDRAQQKHASRNRPSSAINTDFSTPQPSPPFARGEKEASPARRSRSSDSRSR